MKKYPYISSQYDAERNELKLKKKTKWFLRLSRLSAFTCSVQLLFISVMLGLGILSIVAFVNAFGGTATLSYDNIPITIALIVIGVGFFSFIFIYNLYMKICKFLIKDNAKGALILSIVESVFYGFNLYKYTFIPLPEDSYEVSFQADIQNILIFLLIVSLIKIKLARDFQVLSEKQQGG